jgi:hypothetical protein
VRGKTAGCREPHGGMLPGACPWRPSYRSLTGVPKPPKPPTELDEVERAISLLEGRHPEHEKTRRETLAAAEQRGHELRKELAQSARRRTRRAIVLVANLTAAAIAGTVAWKLVVRTRAIQAALEKAESPWLARGFERIASNALTARLNVEADLPGSSCFVAVATVDGALRASIGSSSLEASRSVTWCSCAPAHVTIEGPAGLAPVGIAVLRVDARVFGGPLARAWNDFAPGVLGGGDRECADRTLDEWLADKRWSKPALDDAWFGVGTARASLRRAGFRIVAAVEPARPFGVVEAAAGDCQLALSGGDEPLSLRATGATWLMSKGRSAMAWCSSEAATTTVWRDGTSPVTILAAPASRVGGLLGTRECAEAGGVPVPVAATWLRDADLAWDASALLRATVLSDVAAGPLPPEPGKPEGQLVSVVLSPGARLMSGPDSIVVACDPPLDVAAGSRESVCASAAPVSFWHKGDAAIAAARAQLPIWLSFLTSHREPDAVARLPELLGLARRLSREGFEPTVLEGVTELPGGVRIIGRAGEDAVVAIGLTPKPPWTLPYTDGVPWDLGDPPRVVPLAPGDTVKLTSSPPPSDPVEKRRTLVFRRTARVW